MDKYSNLKNEILAGDFVQARKTVKTMPFREFYRFMMGQPYHSEKEVVFYFFMVDLIGEKEDAIYHNLASSIMAFGLTWMPGAYNVAMRHLQRAIQLSPDDIGYKQQMLLYNIIPDQLLPKEEALAYAKQVHEDDPLDRLANDILNKYKE